MKKLMIIASASALLAGCITTDSGEKIGPLGMAALTLIAIGSAAEENPAGAQMIQQASENLANRQAYVPPVVQPVTPQNRATMIFCRDVTGNIIGCRQIN